ncbi:ph signal transduction protein [Diplodia corticola]|uniref:Ph signal transduction protein n=1 Tax=Diplodia corticola TaxID=236234 RepID=A0A1J9QT50_9PEZI|nr:ph signal transduction protein [Diplodia corticola]OJD31162.1 ph signal transduction protein [Diplodia corticola]
MPFREDFASTGRRSSVDTDAASCTPFALPSDGVIILSPSSTITLTADALFTPDCTAVPTTSRDASDVIDMQDPFYASVAPQVYATGAATVIAWMLVIMLLITPRTFFVGGPGGRSGLMGRRGMISGAGGGASIIGVGSRPWLQKVAALTVAISMTIATADTFRIAEQQYHDGYMDATAIRQEVVGGLEIKISRLISDIFLLLAQVQTLIRLFPRHKEKVIIKWVGFALIVLDMTFSSINNFMGHDIGRPRQFKDAIPALSYLFELALSMLYAAWVLYYALTKRRYAFHHWMMYNISVVALLSIVAILTPVVFFATDISDYSVAGWGDYFRWVGAAAASVIVWEWVERIEALEREDKKDGILGREIFDGDEMLDITPSEEINWPGIRRDGHNRDDRGSGGGAFSSARGFGYSAIAQRNSRVRQSQFEDRSYVPLGRVHSHQLGTESGTRSETPGLAPGGGPRVPPPVATPISRTDTTSAESTVYNVRYHTATDNTPSVTRQQSTAGEHIRFDLGNRDRRDTTTTLDSQPMAKVVDLEEQAPPQPTVTMFGRFSPLWQHLNPFRRRRTTPPPQLLSARVIEPREKEPPSTPPSTTQSATKSPMQSTTQSSSKHGLSEMKGKIGALFSGQSDKLLDPGDGGLKDADIPVTVIPAQPRGGRTWSPDALKALSGESTNSRAQPNGSGEHERGRQKHGSGEISTDTSSSRKAATQSRGVIATTPTPHPQIQVHDYATPGSTSGPVSPLSPVGFGGPLPTPRHDSSPGSSR